MRFFQQILYIEQDVEQSSIIRI